MNEGVEAALEELERRRAAAVDDSKRTVAAAVEAFKASLKDVPVGTNIAVRTSFESAQKARVETVGSAPAAKAADEYARAAALRAARGMS